MTSGQVGVATDIRLRLSYESVACTVSKQNKTANSQALAKKRKEK